MNEHTRIWSLQEAKAKFSEVVRRAQTEGPQVVTVHGKEAVTITATGEASPEKRKLTGKDFFEALSAGPHFEIEIPERPEDACFRDIDLE